MVQKSLETDPVIQNQRWQLEVERYGIRVVLQAVYFRYLLAYRIYLDVLCPLATYPMKVVLQHFGFDDLQIYGDSLVVSLNYEEIILQVIVAVFAAGVSWNRAGVLLLLDKEE